MSSLAPKGEPKSVADWLALPDAARIELIDGEFVEKAAPTFEHGLAQGHTVRAISGVYNRWWIVTEVDILLDGRVYRPDITGWRRDRAPAPLRERPVAL